MSDFHGVLVIQLDKSAWKMCSWDKLQPEVGLKFKYDKMLAFYSQVLYIFFLSENLFYS